MSAVEQLLARGGLLDGFRREGRRLFGRCPVHGGDNPRAFVVDLQGDRWYCFTGCRRGGGPVALARALDLAGPETWELTTPRVAVQPFVPYVRTLHLDPSAPFLRSKGIGPDIARAREVGGWHGHGMLEGCVAVRLHDRAGRPLGYAGRRLAPQAVASRGKWVFPRGLPKSELLYGAHHVRARVVALTECPWGVLRLAQLGVPAVALLGVGISASQASALAVFERVIGLLDGDPAGRAGADQLERRLGSRAVIVELPQGADPDDLTDAALASLVLPFLDDRSEARLPTVTSGGVPR